MAVKLFNRYPVQFIVSTIISVIVFICSVAVMGDRAIARGNENKIAIEKSKEERKVIAQVSKEERRKMKVTIVMKNTEQDKRLYANEKKLDGIVINLKHIMEAVDRIEQNQKNK